MCPICWATMISAFSLYLGGAAAVIAGRDLLTLLGSASLLTMAGLHSFQWAALPWWSFVAAAAFLACRICWLVFQQRDKLLIAAAWRHARTRAAGQCPNQDHKSL